MRRHWSRMATITCVVALRKSGEFFLPRKSTVEPFHGNGKGGFILLERRSQNRQSAPELAWLVLPTFPPSFPNHPVQVEQTATIRQSSAQPELPSSRRHQTKTKTDLSPHLPFQPHIGPAKKKTNKSPPVRYRNVGSDVPGRPSSCKR